MKNQTAYLLILCGVLSILLSSCFSFTNYHTGRVLGKGNREYSASLNGIGAASSSSSLTLHPFIPEFNGANGLTDKLDIVFKYNFPAGLFAGVKYQLIGDRESKFAGSIGAVAGGLFLASIQDENDRLTLGFYNLQIPMNFSYHPNHKLALGLSPSYNRLGFFSSVEEEGGNQLGMSPHFEVGKKFRFLTSATFLIPLDSNVSDLIFQYGRG